MAARVNDQVDHPRGALVTTKQRILALTAVTLVATVGTVVGARMADAATASGAVKVSSVTLSFTAGSNVANTVSVSGTRDGFMVIEDLAAPITITASAQSRCTALSTSKVRCTGIHVAEVDLGNRDDTLDVSGYLVTFAHGRSGNDRLSANWGQAWLWGDEGNDELSGGSNDDTLDAGTGAGQHATGGAGNDVCFGEGLTSIGCESP
jgi:Ca2+-binding RTX toxin-like protein